MTDLSDRQKMMLFCIEAYRNLCAKMYRPPECPNLAEELFKLFCEEFDYNWFYEATKDRTMR